MEVLDHLDLVGMEEVAHALNELTVIVLVPQGQGHEEPCAAFVHGYQLCYLKEYQM